MKKVIIVILSILVILMLGFGVWFWMWGSSHDQFSVKEGETTDVQRETIENLLQVRRSEIEKNEKEDPFGEDGLVRILFLGIDKRVGEMTGHCDAIQMITIDKKNQKVTITAVPRGTYSPLPKGGKYLPSDYYVSNACAIGGLEYGIEQIEKILGEKADYLVILGFSEALGIFRYLGLPTTETLQWLRHRQGYAIGEPQRAHNHSTFIKQMMIKYIPEKSSMTDRLLQYILYKMVKTDLSFAKARAIVDILSAMDLADKPSRIHLAMKPAYMVQDIPYAEEYLSEYLDKMIKPIKDLLPGSDYAGLSKEEAQEKLLKIIDEKKEDPEFISWAFENKIWLQIEDKEKRLATQYDFLKKYLILIPEAAEREKIIVDYILEMEYYGENEWIEKSKMLLEKSVE